ncbi:hypothetical protein ACH5RR_035380 [Cinchona calisaya]|uniref:UVR domain-containing protein n=1 Tax=Cinchona calisaya TaxID=153742 RepID=A0ABD2YHP1_9GENT
MASSPIQSTIAGESDDMDSLFEGMVVFTPPHMDSNFICDDERHQPQPQDEGKQSSSDAASADSLSASSSSVPLDENLFSDLNLIIATTPEELDHPPSPSSSTLVSHSQPQTSTRKKRRAAGLRIGYGRDRDGSPPHLQVPNSNHHSHSPKSPPVVAAPEEKNYHTFSTAKDTANHHTPEQNVQVQGEQPVVSTTGRTIESRFEEIKALVTEKLNGARSAVSSVSATRKESITKRRKATQQLSQASTKYSQLEKQLEDACEAEDFEKAERLSQSLAPAEKERELLVAVLLDAEDECDAVDSKMLEALDCQIQAEEESASLLHSFALDASNNADLVLENAEAVSLRAMEELLSSTEVVELKKLELEIESQLINETRLALNTSIEHLVEDDHRERDILYKKRETLLEDLEKLLALVKEKEAEIAENNFNIGTVEKRIAGVVSNFEEVHSGLGEKHNNLQLDLHQLDLEYKLLGNRKKQIDDDHRQEEARGSKMREISRISADEANMHQDVVMLRKSLVHLIQKFMEDKMRLSKTEQQLSKDVNMLRLGISAARASLQELSSSKSSIQQEAESFKQRLFFIDKRVPELEAEKKVAATTRNFKEAARIATESKTLCVEREGLRIKMEDATLQLQTLEEQICSIVNGLEHTESQVLMKEKELGMARLQRLTLIAEAATAERYAALELGDVEEADTLLAEADAAAGEARKLQPLYSFKDEDFGSLPKHFVPMELVSNLGGKQLAELVASTHAAS